MDDDHFFDFDDDKPDALDHRYPNTPEDYMAIKDRFEEEEHNREETYPENDPEAYLEEPKWVRVASNAISQVRYSYATELLEIEFRHAGVYSYYQVPEFVYQGLINSPSPGRFYHSHIKSQFE